MFEHDEIILEAKHVTRRFPASDGRTLVANDDINLKFYKGKTLGLVGESGCGKSTFMRFLVSLDTPSEGEILYRGKDITKLKGEELRQNRQNIQMVFQDPTSSFNPKMKIRDIVCEPLLNFNRIRKNEKDAACRRLLEMVELPGDFADRYPHNMSGGQRQRVAIARSLVNNPKVLLLDEPLGALDLQLRRAMQLELKRLQKKLGITFIYITHDQEEAINMSDRIAVMNKGTFEQIGTPDEIYNHPKTSYVATFVGNANILKGTAQETEADILKVSLAGSIVSAVAEGKKIAPGTPVTLAVRSENMIFDETCQSGMEAVVVEKSFAGGLLRVVLKLADGTEVIANRHGIDAGVQPGQKVTCHFDAENAVLVDLPSETESGAAV